MLIGTNCLLYLENVGKTKDFIKPTKIMRFESNNYVVVNREMPPNYIPDWLVKMIQERPMSNPELNNQSQVNNVNQNVNNGDGFGEEDIPF